MALYARCVFVVAVLLLASVARPAGAAAQDAQRGSITGLVLDESGRLRNSVAVRLTPEDEGNPAVMAISGDDGRYAFIGVRPGSYTADIVGDHHQASGRDIRVVAGTETTQHLVSRAGSRWISVLVLLSLLLFAGGVLTFRHHNIVLTNRELLRAQLENIAIRIPLESDPGRGADSALLAARVTEIKGTLAQLGWMEWLFWSRGREIAAWVRLHEIERQLIAFLVPEARVVERAITAEAELRQLRSDVATVLANRMRVTLEQIMTATNQSVEPVPPHLLEHLTQQLAEALTIVYASGDTSFAGLMEWHNKAMWLVYLSLLGIFILGVVFHHEELFLIGAVGGLMSRMARSLFREDVPSDYGASWTTLFLSPLLGAISAWIGIALVMWLTEMGVLGENVFGRINWNAGVDATLIAIAFTLGFSERLFTSLLTKAERRIDDELKRLPVPTPPPGPAPGGGPVPGPGPVAGVQGAAPALTHADRVIRELDLQRGERAAFIGDPSSPARGVLAATLGADNVFDVAAATIASKAPLDAVLFEATPTIAGLSAAAAQIKDALRPDGRVVILGSTPAALFDADADAQRVKNHVGPTLVKDVLTTTGGLSSQEPPEQLGGTDPVAWLAAFVKPAPGGSDR